MIKTGKGKLEWERKIPEDQINDLKVMLEADNFNDNLPAVKIFLRDVLFEFHLKFWNAASIGIPVGSLLFYY